MRSFPLIAAALAAVRAQTADSPGVLTPPPWLDGPEAMVGGCFVAFLRGQAGPGRAGDRALVGAVTMSGQGLVSEVVPRTR